MEEPLDTVMWVGAMERNLCVAGFTFPYSLCLGNRRTMFACGLLMVCFSRIVCQGGHFYWTSIIEEIMIFLLFAIRQSSSFLTVA